MGREPRSRCSNKAGFQINNVADKANYDHVNVRIYLKWSESM